VLGPEHPATLTDRHGLAGWTADAGGAAGARDQYGALLPIRERVSGPEHPATLAIRGNHPLLPRRARQVRHDVAARRPGR
jgi:hypothetical protein